MNKKCRPTTDHDNGMAQRHREKQQRMPAMLTALFSAGKELTILFKQCDNSI